MLAADTWVGPLAKGEKLPPKVPAYLPPSQFLPGLPRARRSWWVNGECVSYERQGGGVVRSLRRFPLHLWGGECRVDPDTFHAFLAECRDAGAPCPSSCPDVFHRRYQSPRLNKSTLRMFDGRVRGAWEEAVRLGRLHGTWRVYDIRKAYLWASTLGLPVVASLRHSRAPGSLPGLYVVDLQEPREGLPYPFNTCTQVVATTQELDSYGLPVARMHGGVTWSDSEPADLVTSQVLPLTFSKYVASQYWGRWLSAAPVWCQVGRRRWPIANPVYNPLWATVVLSRVRMRLFEQREGAAHVYVDSVLTQRTLPTGPDLGDWRLEAEYPEGVEVYRAGCYGPPGAIPDKHTGLTVAQVRGRLPA